MIVYVILGKPEKHYGDFGEEVWCVKTSTSHDEGKTTQATDFWFNEEEVAYQFIRDVNKNMEGMRIDDE